MADMGVLDPRGCWMVDTRNNWMVTLWLHYYIHGISCLYVWGDDIIEWLYVYVEIKPSSMKFYSLHFSWVKLQGDWAFDMEIAKKNSTPWFIGFESNLLLNHISQFHCVDCNVNLLYGLSTWLMLLDWKQNCDGLPWWWLSHVHLYVQQPW